MSHLFLDQLDPERQRVFDKLAAFADTFVLAGGTAIMLQIGHRKSFDFDCFSLDSPPKTILPKVKRVFGTNVYPTIQTRDFLTVYTPEHVELTFAKHPFKPLRPIMQTSSIPLFHMDDLVANKAYTIGRRPAWRDYVDLFFVLKWNLYTLENVIQLAERKFSGEFNAKLLLPQLTYFEDIKPAETTFLKESYNDEEIKAFLNDQVDTYLATILPQK
ncbi:MAG: nucleotidyl transferase AbiEii/AbiGii toxin family protein [Candidatus Gottesmanbacteria bacterium]|nr:nucleotidyl transferase AbiEii/AbiGii toxin family protein [Candidatus Gottesmanbacteria bacterium]